MFTASLLLLLAGADPAAKEPPAKLELFAKEEFYKSQPGKEEDFVGVVRKVKGGGGIGFGRFNPYRLEMQKDGKAAVREIYVGGKRDVLDPYLGKRVKITGKAVDMEVEGKMHHEIWPARLEVVAEGKKEGAAAAPAPDSKPEGKELKLQARGFWRAPARPGTAAQQLVIRSPEELAKATGMPAEQAEKALAQALKVEKIDWKTHMVVVATAGAKPTGGYRVEITGLPVQDNTLTVKWKLHSPGPGSIVTQAFTHPGEAVLTQRFEGEVKFDPAAPKAPRKNQE